MTNTLSSIHTAATAGIVSVVDGWTAIGIAIMLGLAGWAIASKFLPKKKKVV